MSVFTDTSDLLLLKTMSLYELLHDCLKTVSHGHLPSVHLLKQTVSKVCLLKISSARILMDPILGLVVLTKRMYGQILAYT